MVTTKRDPIRSSGTEMLVGRRACSFDGDASCGGSAGFDWIGTGSVAGAERWGRSSRVAEEFSLSGRHWLN
jgi:hypothetical protein